MLRMVVGLSFTAAMLLAGCAATPDVAAYSVAGDSPVTISAATASTTSDAAAPAYVLSDEEKSVDCKRLTGRMKIRIMQLRDEASRVRTTELSRSLQSATSKFIGSSAGSDPDGDHRRDMGMLEAYNGQLAAKGCKTLDLSTELKPAAAAAAVQPKP